VAVGPGTAGASLAADAAGGERVPTDGGDETARAGGNGMGGFVGSGVAAGGWAEETDGGRSTGIDCTDAGGGVGATIGCGADDGGGDTGSVMATDGP